MGSGHLHRVRQAARAPARADRRHQDARLRPARRSLPAACRGPGPVLPGLSLLGHAARRAGRAGRGVGVPDQPARQGQARPGCQPRDRGGLRVLLGPAATGRVRLPRDRARRPAAGLLAVRVGQRPDPGRGLLGAAAGLRQGGPGLHGGRHRALPGHRRPARQGPAPRRQPPKPARRQPPKPARHRRAPDRGRAVPAHMGLRLVVRGHRGDHPALQPGPSLRLLERRRDPGPRRAPLGVRRIPAARPRLAGQARDPRAAPAADRVHRAPLAAGPDRRPRPAAALPVHRQQLLGDALALQRHRDADRLRRRRRRPGPDRAPRPSRAAFAPHGGPEYDGSPRP